MNSLNQIKARHIGQYIEINDAGMIWDDATEQNVQALDVIVWECEDDSENDDGSMAIARYLIVH